jgi:hypothetical protein
MPLHAQRAHPDAVSPQDVTERESLTTSSGMSLKREIE